MEKWKSKEWIHERLEQALMEVMQDNWDAKQL